jgi:hypothetical protein
MAARRATVNPLTSMPDRSEMLVMAGAQQFARDARRL